MTTVERHGSDRNGPIPRPQHRRAAGQRLSLVVLLTCAVILALPLVLSVAGFESINANLATIMAAISAVMGAACLAISAVASRRPHAEAEAAVVVLVEHRVRSAVASGPPNVEHERADASGTHGAAAVVDASDVSRSAPDPGT